MLFGSRLNRLATSIRRGISKYSVGSDNPSLVFDFIDNFYQKDKNQTVNFDGAITHARAGNATMTDGYGPELVSFDNALNWTLTGSATISDGKLVFTDGATGTATFSLSATQGKQYVASIRKLVEGVSGANNVTLKFRSGSSNVGAVFSLGGVNGPKTFEEIASPNFDADAIQIQYNGSGSYEYAFDNVSVREMPVIKWAPHNLLTYSEDFSNSAWVKVGTASITGTKTINLPAVDDRIYQSWSSVVGDVDTFGAILSGSGTVTLHLASGGINVTEQVTLTSTPTLYSVSGTATINATGFVFIRRNSGDTATSVVCDGAMRYRSDLGGMVNNPDRGDSYVPTASAAKYLPRVGHHVYNGSAWVNEGVLAESESRVNLVTYSHDFTNTYWSDASPSASVSLSNIPSPDGTPAYKITGSVGNNYRLAAGRVGNNQTKSIYARTVSGTGTAHILSHNSVSGSLVTLTEEWQRFSLPSDTSETGGSNFYLVDFRGSNTLTEILVYGAQLEAGSTPSSLIPTSGSSVTRAAESFTIPSANLPWPTPQYIGSELVTNGDYGDGTNDWTESPNNNSFTVSSGKLLVESDGSGYGYGYQSFSVESGKTYLVKGDYRMTVSGIHGSVIYVGTSIRNSAYLNSGQNTSNTVTNFEGHFTATATGTAYITVTRTSVASGFFAEFDNISVREINPVSVSIGMEGRMTYADENSTSNLNFLNWSKDANDSIQYRLDTQSTRTGQLLIRQKAGGTTVFHSVGAETNYSPDVFVPFDMAGRHGSTFVNGAVEGVVATEKTTPTALPDLEFADLDLAYDYMGTISEFRVWDKDIGDAGIVEATNPSLEPSLSLTFEGVGTNSFVVNDWSQ